MEQQEITGYVQASIADYKEGLGEFRNHAPDIAEKFMSFSAACFASGTLSEETKHLIALGIGIHSQDEYCIMYHADSALRLGASPDQIYETVGVCAAFGGGAALSQGVTLVQDVIEEHRNGMSAQ